MDVPIEFIGVWYVPAFSKRKKRITRICRDTVSSLGAIRRKSLPVTTASTNAKTFRHALSLDERRARFQAHFWREKQTDHHNAAKDHYAKTDVEEVWFAVRIY